MTEEFSKEIRNKITGFSISRIPDKKKDWFIAFAKEEFCDDRGFALVHLIDFYTGIIPSGIEHVESALNELREEVESLKKQLNKTEEKPIKRMIDGTPIKRKGE